MRSIIVTLIVALSSSHALADDWPQFLGPNRDSRWHESGVMKELPADGPDVTFRVPVGLGYAGPAVVGDRVFVTDYQKAEGTINNQPGTRDKLSGVERVLCLDANSGEQLWEHKYERKYNVSYGGGPRCTPTVDAQAGRVYTLGAMGDLLCLNIDDGEVVWSRKLTEDYKTDAPFWGFSAHPLIDGDLLHCLVGGAGSTAVAFNKHTGEEVWKALSTEGDPGYCSPSIIEHGGVRQLIIWHSKALNSLDPKTGDVYWSEDLAPSYNMSIAIPQKHGDFLFASGIGNVGALYKLSTDKPAAEVVWRGKPKTALYAANVTPMIDDGIIYGSDCSSGQMIAARLSDGERLWETTAPTAGADVRRPGHGSAFMAKNDDRYYIVSETGDLIIAKLSAESYEEISRFHILQPTSDAFGRPVVWSHPAFAKRSVFARNDKELVRVDLAQ